MTTPTPDNLTAEQVQRPPDVSDDQWREMRQWWDAFKGDDTARAVYRMATNTLEMRGLLREVLDQCRWTTWAGPVLHPISLDLAGRINACLTLPAEGGGKGERK